MQVTLDSQVIQDAIIILAAYERDLTLQATASGVDYAEFLSSVTRAKTRLLLAMTIPASTSQTTTPAPEYRMQNEDG